MLLKNFVLSGKYKCTFKFKKKKSIDSPRKIFIGKTVNHSGLGDTYTNFEYLSRTSSGNVRHFMQFVLPILHFILCVHFYVQYNRQEIPLTRNKIWLIHK